jgi:hypothetical protein
MYFFRDSAGNEIDLLLEKDGSTIPIEIKSARKLDSAMLGGLKYWKKYNLNCSGILVYGGSRNEELNDGMQLMSWNDVKDV